MSGGGTHGFAQVGVLKVLFKHGIKPYAIAGCSMGALIGMSIAAGKKIEEIEEMMFSKNLFSFIDPSFFKAGFVKGEKIISFFLNFANVNVFEDLRMPFAINALNINTGEEKAFKTGPLACALNASIAVPGVFLPRKIGEDYFVDGGIINPLPIHLLPEVDTIITIEVSRINNKILYRSSPVSVIQQSMGMMQRQIVEEAINKIPKSKRLIRIIPDLDKYGLFEYKRDEYYEMLKIGEECAEAVLLSEKIIS